MNLRDFVLDRIAEKEAKARALERMPRWVMAGNMPHALPGVAEHVIRQSPARVLAECAAVRCIVDQAAEATSDRYSVISEFCVTMGETQEAMDTDPGNMILRALASIDAEHPDFDPEWRLP